jgi:hypothetical protein
MAAAIPGAPARLKRVYGRWSVRAGAWTVEESIAYWEEVLAGATRKHDIKLATSHLYDAYVSLHRRQLDPLLKGFETRFGRCPEDWQSVVDVGWLLEVPLDYVGNPYRIDGEQCILLPHKRIR